MATEDTVAAIGPAVVASIIRYRSAAGRDPTWAEALGGIDQGLLTPLTVLPPRWPLPPAVWRRDLRTRLMDRLKHTAWVSFSATPRSLRVGSRGRAWLTGTAHPAPGNGTQINKSGTSRRR